MLFFQGEIPGRISEEEKAKEDKGKGKEKEWEEEEELCLRWRSVRK